MTPHTEAADAVLDEVMVLGFELCAIAKPKNPAAFVELLSRFTHAVIREAFEHQDEIRLRLGIARPRVNEQPADHDGRHSCSRRRELGLVDATSSTGATEAKPKADTASSDKAATEPSAAPITSTLPAAGPVSAAPSQEGAEPATGGAVSIAEPASPKVSGDVGTPPAGPDAGAEESQRRRPGAPAKRSAEQKADLYREYRAACAVNGGNPPRGWVAAQSRKLDVSYQTIYRAIGVDDDKQPEREHANSHACWCRRKPCNTKNPWCKIAPASKPPGSLAGLQEQPRRSERYLRRME